MSRATVFLRQPAGVAIRTQMTTAEAANILDDPDRLSFSVVNDRGQTVRIPVDNVASVEIQ